MDQKGPHGSQGDRWTTKVEETEGVISYGRSCFPKMGQKESQVVERGNTDSEVTKKCGWSCDPTNSARHVVPMYLRLVPLVSTAVRLGS
jgi:hypothetical protein